MPGRKIRKLLVTGDNRLKQGAGAEKARESWEQALEVAREAGLEDRCARSSRSGSADLERLTGSARGSPRSAPPAGSRRARPRPPARRRSGSGSAAAARIAVGDRLLVERVDQDTGLGRHELRRAADPRRDHGPAAGHRLEERLAERLDEARLADDVGGARASGRPGRARRGRPAGCPAGPRAARAAARRRRTPAGPRRGARTRRARRSTFLRSSRPPTQTNAGPSPSQPSSALAAAASAGAKRSRSTPQSTTSTRPRASGMRSSSSRRR